jgi:hypothetical protein
MEETWLPVSTHCNWFMLLVFHILYTHTHGVITFHSWIGSASIFLTFGAGYRKKKDFILRRKND